MNGYLLRWFGVFISLSSLASATELTRAIRLEDAPAVEAAIKSGKDINTLDGDLLSPLFYAILAGRPEWVKSLLAQGAKPDDEKQRTTPLRAAATKGDAVSAKLLLDAGAKVGTFSIKGKAEHPVFAAIQSGSVEVLTLLLEKVPGHKLDEIFFGSSDPSMEVVMDAVVNRNAEVALFLINHGCVTTYRSQYGNVQDETPILVAAIESGPLFESVVDRLIALGQSPVRRRFAIDSSMLEVPPWDALTAAVRHGDLKRATQFMPEPMDLEQPYRLFLLRYAQNCGNPAMLELVKKRLGGELRPKPGVPAGYTEPPPVDVDVTRVLLPRRAKVPALKAPKAPVTVAVISSPGAENAGESLSALLPSLPGWKVVERGAVEALLREKEYQAPWADGTKDLTGLGDRLAADTLLLVTKVGDKSPALMRLEVVDVRTGLALRRVHVSMEKFNPEEFSKEIAAEVVAARERFAASGGRITAVSVLDIACRTGEVSHGGLPALVGLGLKEEIDNTAGAVAITRNQMQPLMEEKVVAGSGSLWAAAWSLEGGLQMLTEERAKLELRATNLRGGKKVDVAVEGAVSDPRALVRAAWAKLREAAGLLGAAATPDPEAARREAEGLVAEAEWLMACQRPAEAARIADAAFYLGADPQRVIPLRINCHSLALPNAGKQTFWYPEFGQPLLGLRMLARMPEFIEMAEILDRSLAEYPEAFKEDFAKGSNPTYGYSFTSAWSALSRLITYRLSLPEIELTPEEVQSFREFDQVLDRVEARLFALVPGSRHEVQAMSNTVNWLKLVDLSRIPHFRERLVEWIVGFLERGSSDAQDGVYIIEELLNSGGGRLGWSYTIGYKFQSSERRELGKLFLSRLEKSSHPEALFCKARLKMLVTDDRDQPEAIRELLEMALKMVEDGKPPHTLFVGFSKARVTYPYMDYRTVVPFSADSILPELIHHPRLCGEFLNNAPLYFAWIQRRNDLAKGSGQWLRAFVDNFPKPLKRSAPAPIYRSKELLALSYRQTMDSKGLFAWISKVVDLPVDVRQTLQESAASQPDLAPDVRNFGAHGLVPEIRFRNEIQPAKRVTLVERKGASRFVSSPKSMAQNMSAKQLWIGGTTGRFDELPIRVKAPTFEPLLVRYDLDSEKLTEFRPPSAAEPRWNCESQITIADGFCVLQTSWNPIFAAPTKGEKSFGWGKEIKAEDSGGTPLPSVSYEGSVYAIATAPANVGMEDQTNRRLYRLTPGAAPIVLADNGRRPAQSPLDNSRYIFQWVVAQDERVVLLARESEGAVTVNAYASYDPKDGSWKAGGDTGEAAAKGREVYAEQRSRDREFFSLSLSDGSEFSMPHIHVPGQLVFLSKASGEKEQDYFVPIALSVPDDPALRFKIKLQDDVITEDLLTSAECLRSAYIRPVLVAQTDTHLIIAAEFGDYVPFPYLWYISKADIERNLKEQMAKRK